MRALLVLLPLALVLAGCVEGGREEPTAAPADLSLHAVPSAALEPGRAYAFDHPGGPLRLWAPDGAEVALYGPDDTRLARVPLPPGRTAHIDVAPGEAVVRVLAANGTLRLASGAQGGPEVTALRPLPTHMERVPLAVRPAGPVPSVPELPILREPLEVDEAVSFARAPTDLRLLASGTFEDLAVTVTGARGVALEAAEEFSGGFGGALLPSGGFFPVDAAVFPDNLEGAAYGVRAEAAHLDGALVLEAWSYSRARPLEPAGAQGVGRPATLPYEYGALPDRPASFFVHAAASRLLFVNPGADAAAVALFGPHDERLGTFPVPSGAAVAVPVAGGGAFVAVALSGEVVLGADRAPADLDSLHVLERGVLRLPSQPPGDGGGYGQAEEDAHAPGVPYAAVPSTRTGGLEQPLAFGCTDGGSVRLAQEGETIGVWGDVPLTEVNASLHLRDGALRVVADGFGSECGGPAVALHWYRRPGEASEA